MERKELGKIKNAYVGYGGYQSVQFGLFLSFGGDAWGVSGGDVCGWSTDIKCDGNCKWTEADRIEIFGQAMLKANELCNQAKVKTVTELVGVPVEVTFDGMVFKSFRILTEVL